MKKRNVLNVVGVVALSSCLVIGLAACGGSAIDEAKSIRGEEVTEAEWKAALSEVSTEGTGISALAADDAEEGANFAVSYATRADMSLESEGGNIGDQEIEAMSVSAKAEVSADLVVADGKMHITMNYSVSLTGSENLLELMETDPIDESGKVEIYTSVTDSSAEAYVSIDGGEWKKYSAGASLGVSSAVLSQLESLVQIADCSGYADMFSSFEYSDEDKGYAFKGSVEGDDVFGADASLVIKIKDGKLAAIVSEGSADSNAFGMKTSGSTGTGLVYTFGGQSITLPEV